MNRKIWLISFLIFTAADIFAIATHNNDLRWFTKIFIVPLLIGYLISSLILIKALLHKWVIAALICSWIGDVLLMFESQNSLFFILGLISFLFAHVCYIYFFQVVKRKENLRWNWFLIVPVIIYYFSLLSFLYSHLRNLKIPVIIYGALISTMLVLALHLEQIKYRQAGLYMMSGAALFIISDSVLAFNKFYAPFELASVIIMTTYAFAQLFITTGVIKYIRQTAS